MTHKTTLSYQRRLRYVRKLGQAKVWSNSEPGETLACGLEVSTGSMLSIGFGVAALRPRPRYHDCGGASDFGDDWHVLPRIATISNLSSANRRSQPMTTYHQQLPSPRPTQKLEGATLTSPAPSSLSQTSLSVNDKRFTTVSQQMDLIQRQQSQLPRTGALKWQQRPLASSAAPPTARRLSRAATTVGISVGNARTTSSSYSTVGPWRGSAARVECAVHQDEAVLVLRHLQQSLTTCPHRPAPAVDLAIDDDSIIDTLTINARRLL